ncbi:hypothetical protein ACJX0J_041113 [Zea mays]
MSVIFFVDRKLTDFILCVISGSIDVSYVDPELVADLENYSDRSMGQPSSVIFGFSFEGKRIYNLHGVGWITYLCRNNNKSKGHDNEDQWPLLWGLVTNFVLWILAELPVVARDIPEDIGNTFQATWVLQSNRLVFAMLYVEFSSNFLSAKVHTIQDPSIVW